MGGSGAGGQDGGSWRVVPVHPARPWLVGLIFWMALLPLTIRPRHSGNVWSRYMTIESIVERGTLAIEGSPLRQISGSPDVIRVGRHLYSDKPPVLSTLAALGYAPLTALGIRLAGSPGQFAATNLALTWGIVGLSSSLAIVGLRQIFQAAPVPRLAADLLALACGFGSLLLTYGVTFNNHSVAAGLLTMALALVLGEDPAALGVRRRRALAGLLSGLAATIDLPAGGALMAALATWEAVRLRGVPAAFLAGCAGPLALHTLLQTLITGSPLPAEMTPEVLNFEGSYWATEAGRFRETGPRWQFGLELLVGPQGWLTVTPVLAFGLIGIGRTAARRGDPMRPAALAVGATVAVLLAFYTWGVRRTDFAGLSYGTRHLLAISPPVYAFAIVALARSRRPWAWAVFAALWAVGAVYAWEGQRDPWSRIERRPEVALRILQRGVLYPWTSYRR